MLGGAVGPASMLSSCVPSSSARLTLLRFLFCKHHSLSCLCFTSSLLCLLATHVATVSPAACPALRPACALVSLFALNCRGTIIVRAGSWSRALCPACSDRVGMCPAYGVKGAPRTAVSGFGGGCSCLCWHCSCCDALLKDAHGRTQQAARHLRPLRLQSVGKWSEEPSAKVPYRLWIRSGCCSRLLGSAALCSRMAVSAGQSCCGCCSACVISWVPERCVRALSCVMLVPCVLAPVACRLGRVHAPVCLWQGSVG